MDNIIVSVVMVTYNHEKYIKQAIDSILIQKTNFNFEIIIGEDCSIDNTRKILYEYKEKYPEIIKIIFHENNVGATRNLFLAISQCRGKYIAYLEGDDYWIDEYKLQKQVDFLETNHDYLGVAHNFNNVNKNGELISLNIIPKHFLSERFALKDFMKWLFVFHTATIMHRNIFTSDLAEFEIIYLASPIVGDLTILFILLHKGDFFILPDIMSAYRCVNELGATNALSIAASNPVNSIKLSINQLNIIEEHFSGKYDLSQLKSRFFVSFLISHTMFRKNSVDFNEIIKLYISLSYRVRIMVIFRILLSLITLPIRKTKKMVTAYKLRNLKIII